MANELRTYTGDDCWCSDEAIAAASGAVDVDGDAQRQDAAEERYEADPDLMAECENADDSDADRYAEWIVRKMAEAERAMNVANRTVGERVAELYAEIARLELRNEERTRPLVRNLEWLHGRFDDVLKIYAAAKTSPKSRTVKLLYGTLAFRKNPDVLNVVDEAAAIEWARANAPQAVKLSILKTPLKEYFKALGDLPPGCEFVAGEEVFTVKTEEAKR